MYEHTFLQLFFSISIIENITRIAGSFTFSGIALFYWRSTNVLFIDLPVIHLLLATRQRVIGVKNTQLVAFLIYLQLIFDILCYCLRILPYRTDVVALAPKSVPKNSIFQHVFIRLHKIFFPNEKSYAMFIKMNETDYKGDRLSISNPNPFYSASSHVCTHSIHSV